MNNPLINFRLWFKWALRLTAAPTASQVSAGSEQINEVSPLVKCAASFFRFASLMSNEAKENKTENVNWIYSAANEDEIKQHGML